MQATSQQHLGEYVYQLHPNLRKQTNLKFSSPDELDPCDVMFLAMPHGKAQHHIDQYVSLAGRIIDLSADFRLQNPVDYEKWYGTPHAAPTGWKNLCMAYRNCIGEELKNAKYVSGVGCNATACNLACFH